VMPPVLAIVDHPQSRHGRLMEHAVRCGIFVPAIHWVEPSLQLPETLMLLEGVGAVAMPLSIRHATPRDRFTQQVMLAISALMERGIPVFVAAGNGQPNILAQAGFSVSTRDIPGSTSTSEACVRAAVQAMLSDARRLSGMLDP
jgi:hypothetical protein